MRDASPEGNAIVYCEGEFGTTNGKTAHGLVRRSARFAILGVVDSTLAGRDAGEILDGRKRGIPVLASLEEALGPGASGRDTPTHMIVGLAPDGGRLPPRAREDVRTAVTRGLHVICGLHDWLSEDPELSRLAEEQGVQLLDIRRPPPRSELHFFTGKIENVESARVAVLGTDSAVGKRTTAWMLVDALGNAGHMVQLIGTGQTAWLQGARYSLIMDAIVNDFVTGEIEHATWKAWQETGADALVIEGQGSLMNPAYPGGFEILAAARPDAIVLQHPPQRREYDGLPGYAMHPLDMQITALELVSQRPVVAVTVSGEGMDERQSFEACARITRETGLVAVNPVLDGLEPVVETLRPFLPGGSEWTQSRAGKKRSNASTA